MNVPTYIHHSGWPWPLDAVQGWFEDLWGLVNNIPGLAASYVWTWMPASLKGFIDFLGGLAPELYAKISGFFMDPLGSIKPGFDGVISSLISWIGWWDPVQGRFVGGFLGWLWDAEYFIVAKISEGAGWVWDQINPVLAQVRDGISGFPKFVTDILGSKVGWLHDTLQGWKDGALRWASESFRWLDVQISNGLWWAVDRVGTMFDGASTIIGDVISGVFTGALGVITGPFNFFLGAFGGVDIAGHGSDVTAIFDGINSSYQALLAAHSPLTPEEAIIATDAWRSEQRGYWYMLYITALAIEGASLGQIETPNMMLLSDPQCAASMDLAKRWYAAPYEYGHSVRLQQFWNKVYTPQLPPVVDLIRFVVREVITPERFAELMPYHGFSSEFAKNYWDAHWILPAPGNLYDAYHRDIINREELGKFLVWHDYSPDPRPGISKSDVDIMAGVIKTLIPRVDLRYGWEMGRLTDEDLVERYRKLGYEDDSELMADIQKDRALVEEITKVRDEWFRYFIEGFIDEDVLRANLEAIGIGPARIEYYVAYCRKRREREQLKDLLDLYRDGYMKDIITEEDLRARISEILVDVEAVDLYVEKAYVDKYKKPKPPTETEEDKALEELQKYEISYAIEAYRRYAIEKDELIKRLIAAGVHPAVAATRADYEELKRPVPKPTETEIARRKEEAKIQSLAVRTHLEEYKRFEIDESELVTLLMEADLSEALAVAYMQLEMIRRGAPPE